MRVYGLDFTSAPRRGKPITCAAGSLVDRVLHVEGLIVFECFETFENFLVSPGPWIAAMDFPFGQPRKLQRNLGWPETWEEIARLVGAMTPAEFEQVLKDYKATREKGDKHHPRETDVRARSVTPMMLTGVPVGKMFHRGAPLLERTRVNIIPCRPLNKDRYVVEGYPALVARRYIDGTKYKDDARSKQTEALHDARATLMEAIRAPGLADDFGITVEIPDCLAAELVADATADRLDALLCGIQAAWSWTMRDENFGIPADADPAEGWVADPCLTR